MSILVLFRSQIGLHWKLFRRLPGNIFWNSAFPVILLILFTSVFGETTLVEVPVGVIDESRTTFSRRFIDELRGIGIFDVQLEDEATLMDRFHRNQVLGIIRLPPEFVSPQVSRSSRVHIVYNPLRPTLAELFSGSVRTISANFARPQEPIVATLHPIKARFPATYVDFLIPGIMGMTLMSVSFFGIGANLVAWRQAGQLRRLRVTPLGAWMFIAALVTSRYLIGLGLAGVSLGAGILLYRLHINGSWVSLFAALSLGLLAFLSVGVALAAVVRTAESAISVANILYVFFMVLGGSFFPIKNLPALMAPVVLALPSFHFLVLLRAVINAGESVMEAPLSIAALGVWAAVSLGVAALRFRWE